MKYLIPLLLLTLLLPVGCATTGSSRTRQVRPISELSSFNFVSGRTAVVAMIGPHKENRKEIYVALTMPEDQIARPGDRYMIVGRSAEENEPIVIGSVTIDEVHGRVAWGPLTHGRDGYPVMESDFAMGYTLKQSRGH